MCGLMQAVERFEPEKGFRFATYAMWWIKAAIQEYILRSVVAGEAGYDRQPEEAVLRPAQDQEQDLGGGGRCCPAPSRVRSVPGNWA